MLYLELLAESIPHQGELRCSQSKAYTPEMIGALFSMTKNEVERAFELLTDLELMHVKSDGTLTFPQIDDMMGIESGAAQRMRKLRSGKYQQKGDETDENPQIDLSSEEHNGNITGTTGEQLGTKREKCSLENRVQILENSNTKQNSTNHNNHKYTSDPISKPPCPPVGSTSGRDENFQAAESGEDGPAKDGSTSGRLKLLSREFLLKPDNEHIFHECDYTVQFLYRSLFGEGFWPQVEDAIGEESMRLQLEMYIHEVRCGDWDKVKNHASVMTARLKKLVKLAKKPKNVSPIQKGL